jgi:hypothetical protein
MLQPKFRNRAFTKALSNQIWDPREIQDIAVRAGLDRGDLPCAQGTTPSHLWTEVFQLAFNYGVMDALLAILKMSFRERAQDAATVLQTIED